MKSDFSISDAQKGEIATAATLIGIFLIGIGIFAGGKLVEIGTKYLPKASTTTYGICSGGTNCTESEVCTGPEGDICRITKTCATDCSVFNNNFSACSSNTGCSWTPVAPPPPTAIPPTIAPVIPTVTPVGPGPSVDANLFSHYKLDETAGTQAADSSGNNRQGTYIGSTAATGKINGGRSFNGTSDNVSVPVSALSNNFTIEMWVKPDKTHEIDTQSQSGIPGTAGQRYAWWSGGAANTTDASALISVGTNGISVYEHAGGYMPAVAVYSGTVSSVDWNHVALVYSNKQPLIYLNGNLVKSGAISPKTNIFPYGTGGWNEVNLSRIGGGVFGYFSGGLDDVRLYNKALTAADVQTHFLGTTVPTVTPILFLTPVVPSITPTSTPGPVPSTIPPTPLGFCTANSQCSNLEFCSGNRCVDLACPLLPVTQCSGSYGISNHVCVFVNGPPNGSPCNLPNGVSGQCLNQICVVPLTVPTLTPTRTPTPTPTSIPTSTSAPTRTPTPTLTPTNTPTPTPTQTSTPTRTPTPTPTTPVSIPTATRTVTPSPIACPGGANGNLNCDSGGLINETDLAILVSKWSPSGPVPTPNISTHRSADIAGGANGGADGKVNESDLGKLLSNWKTQ